MPGKRLVIMGLILALLASAAAGCSTVATSHQSPWPTTPARHTAVTKPEQLVPYHGPVQHIFFHPLVAFPSLAFSPANPQRQGFNDWFVTVPEFTQMLQALYRRHYILVNLNSLYTEGTVDGAVYLKPRVLMLPKGKLPLILSIDDMNYYPYMQKWGTVQRLVLDAKGNVAAWTRFPDGHTSVTYDNAIVPLLDSFVRQHPDFSFHGAKGMINLTGYAGVLGYRTDDTSVPDYPEVKAEAIQVIARLKATGWYFSSHSWGHLCDADISYARFVRDTNWWMQQVEPLVGPTQVYVYPFGSRVRTSGRKFRYLLRQGFHVFCGVGPITCVQWTRQALMMDRRHIDGVSLETQRAALNDLFDTVRLLDPIRARYFKLTSSPKTPPRKKRAAKPPAKPVPPVRSKLSLSPTAPKGGA